MKKSILGLCSLFLIVSASSALAQTGTSTSTTTPGTSGEALEVTLSATPVVRPGSQDSLLGLVLLSSSRLSSNAQLRSLPLSISFAGGMNASSVGDCRVRNLSNLAAPLNTGDGTLREGSNTVSFASPLSIPARSTVSLAITCDIASTAPSGGTILLSVSPGLFSATSASGNAITTRTGVTINGNLGSTAGSVLVSAAAGGPAPTIPGVPNTGGSGMSLSILALSAIAMIVGLMKLRVT